MTLITPNASQEHFYYWKSAYVAMMFPSHWLQCSEAATVHSDKTQMVSAEHPIHLSPRVLQLISYISCHLLPERSPTRVLLFLFIDTYSDHWCDILVNIPTTKENSNKTRQWLNLLLKLCVLSYIHFILEKKKYLLVMKHLRHSENIVAQNYSLKISSVKGKCC